MYMRVEDEHHPSDFGEGICMMSLLGDDSVKEHQSPVLGFEGMLGSSVRATEASNSSHCSTCGRPNASDGCHVCGTAQVIIIDSDV